MTDSPDEPTLPDDGAFSLSDVTPDPAPAPQDAPFVTPDHTASDDSLSVVERVKRAAQGKGTKDRVSDDAATNARPRAAKKKTAPPKTRDGQLVKPLTELYTSIGMVFAPFDPACSMAVIENAERCAISLDKLAQRNDAVRRAILALTETSAWGGVLTAHLPLLLVIVAHHGPRDVAERISPLAVMMNPGLMDTMNPEPGGQRRAEGEAA